MDPQHQLVQLTGATVTPEVAVLTSDGLMPYLGRIDNWYADLGKKRREATRRDLRLVLTALLEGKPIQPARTLAVGCDIPSLP